MENTAVSGLRNPCREESELRASTMEEAAMHAVNQEDYPAQVESWKGKTPPSGWISDFAALGFELAGKHVLDCGCGNGKYGSLLCARGATVVGIDREPECVTAARKNSPCYEDVVLGTLMELPFGAAEFDVALLRYVLHLTPKDDREALLREIRRVVRPGGAVVIETSLREQYARHVDHRVYPRLTEVVSAFYPEYDEMVDLLSQAGFVGVTAHEIVQVKPYTKSVDDMLNESRLLVEAGEGQTAWLCLSQDERLEFHQARAAMLPKLYEGYGEVPQTWVGTFVVGWAKDSGLGLDEP